MEKKAAPRIDNPYALQTARQSSAVAHIESNRAVAEVVASMQVARQFPRDRAKAMDLILTDCTLPVLAEDAVYEYARGGADITGVSIRLAEVLAQRWGNMQCGVKELSRGEGYSEVQAYAMDLETGFKDERTFQVKHWRDRRDGKGYVITDERDIYEVVANQGARRKRACILAVIPKDVQDAAIRQCELTLKSEIEITPDTIKAVLESMAKFGVDQAMIEKRIQRKLEALTPGMYLQLKKIYNSLKDNMSVVGDWFELPGEVQRNEVRDGGRTATDAAAEALAASRKKEAPAPAAAKAAPPPSNPPKAEETGEITNESIREAIKKAGSQEALSPLMFDIMKLPPSTEREETTRLWSARSVELKGGKPAEQDIPPAFKGKPKGDAKIKKDLIKKMNKAEGTQALDDAANEITLYEWSEADAQELQARYVQCTNDLKGA